MPLAVQAYEYLLYQIFSLMCTEAYANETRRKRSTQGTRNFFEHALICGGVAASLGAHGLCPALLSLFKDHLFGSRCPNPTNTHLHQKFWSQHREPVAKAAFRPKNTLGRIASDAFKETAMSKPSFSSQRLRRGLAAEGQTELCAPRATASRPGSSFKVAH
jgi:hypothetical protein